MAEVIELMPRKAKERKRLEARAARRAQAVAGALACGICPRRCAYCGMAIEDQPGGRPEGTPYSLCRDCYEEYQAFLRREQGAGEPEAFWHTEQWAEMWRTWLANMRAKEAFRNSRAFFKLMSHLQD